MRAALVLTLLLLPALASAQDEWVEIHHGALSGRSPIVELGGLLAGLDDETPVRITLSGTLSDLYDGAELDAFGRTLGATRDVAARTLALPAGARLVASDDLAHRYELEIGSGGAPRFVLDVAGLAARHLVTASELRAHLDGAIELSVRVPAAAVAPPVAAAGIVPGATSSSPVLPTAFGLSFGAAALFLAARRRRSPEDLTVARAVRAHALVTKKAKALGPQFEGATRPAGRLLAATRAGRAHLTSLDRELAESAFVVGPEARARRAELAEARRAALARMERSAAALEEAFVRLGASQADRSAAGDVERGLDDLAAEIDVGRAVDRELELASR